MGSSTRDIPSHMTEVISHVVTFILSFNISNHPGGKANHDLRKTIFPQGAPQGNVTDWLLPESFSTFFVRMIKSSAQLIPQPVNRSSSFFTFESGVPRIHLIPLFSCSPYSVHFWPSNSGEGKLSHWMPKFCVRDHSWWRGGKERNTSRSSYPSYRSHMVS